MSYRLTVFSRHPSHNALRRANVMLPLKTSLRLGSTTRGKSKYAIELNNPDSVTISANKKLMKEAFTKANITTAEWWTMETYITFVAGDGHSTDTTETLPYPIVAKHIYGSRGTGNFLIKTKEELSAWLVGKTLTNYIFEKFYNYSREYRLHISKNGCFYACRKMLKNDIPKDKRWYRNDSNSTWILEENPAFNKPATWDTIIKECIIALNTIGLDLAAFDVKVEAKDSNKFIIIESNSAPSFGENTLKQYINEIPKIIY